ncbi:hypothetical protein T484DRAFT_1836675, partial [Baffinella frigidus]
VVCAGVKSILDIPRTLEFLETHSSILDILRTLEFFETHSVATLAYKADSFPAFFTADSGCPPQVGFFRFAF